MAADRPPFLKMIRAPFLSSILSPLFIGTLLAVSITGRFEIINFIFVIIIGIGLHIATNVYNDIYDTLQGTDTINVNRNEFSGGSGVLLEDKELFPYMYRIARVALLVTLLASVALMLLVDPSLRVHVAVLYLLSAFFSKYYTAHPVKLAYRGWGEFFVWLAFGPMAILIASVSQNVAFHPLIVTAMPLTGISTLSILLIGEMIDLEADRGAGKWGVAVRLGNKATAYIYLFVQILLCLDILVISLFFLANGWILLISLLPYVILLPNISKRITTHSSDAEILKQAAKMNVMLHLLFALLAVLSLIVIVLL